MKHRTRDYRKEYADRVKHGLAKGYSRARARGHARAGDVRNLKTGIPNPHDPREKALKLMKDGATQKAAAKKYNVSVEKLRRYVKENTTAKLSGKKWVIIDRRPEEMRIASRGRVYLVPVPYRSKKTVSKYWNAINKFLDTNDASHLAPFQGKGIRDAEGKYHPWETDPNVLRKMDSSGELHIVDIYPRTAQ